jgi:uncharacterized membrane protein YeaQ/YmgE (transglycosylase-associated protein family)
MELIYFILSLVITGAIFGALGRLAVPGPNPMSIGMTILVGIGGAFLGGVVGALLGAPALLVFILEVLGAAGIVYLMQRRPARARTY